jgi:hypothetical protein
MDRYRETRLTTRRFSRWGQIAALLSLLAASAIVAIGTYPPQMLARIELSWNGQPGFSLLSSRDVVEIHRNGVARFQFDALAPVRTHAASLSIRHDLDRDFVPQREVLLSPEGRLRGTATLGTPEHPLRDGRFSFQVTDDDQGHLMTGTIQVTTYPVVATSRRWSLVAAMVSTLSALIQIGMWLIPNPGVSPPPIGARQQLGGVS